MPDTGNASGAPIPTVGTNDALYWNANARIADRVEDLLGRMTLAEKVAQVTAVSLRDSTSAEEGLAGKVNAVRSGIREGIGQIENTFDPRAPGDSAREVNDLQRLLRESTRLGIPALVGSECAHGHAGFNSTVLPVPLAMACSWNPELVEQAFDMAAREARARGAHEAHTPVLDLGRDPRWGRMEETFGEDTYLVTRMGVAATAGLQGGRSGNPGRTHVVAAPKHFAGYGQVVGGRNFAATPVDTRTLRDEVLPPFEAVVKDVKVQGMMASHCDVEGVPAHGNRWLLTGLLRGEWGFEGMVVSDYNDVPRLAYFQHVVETVEDAAALALSAGMDLDLPVGEGYGRLLEVIRTRPELEQFLDFSVRRILRLKFMLGLFEDPFVPVIGAEQSAGCAEHVALAERLATESIVMLKNHDDLLPLDLIKLATICVIGPNAASPAVGNYTAGTDRTTSLLDGVRQRAGSTIQVDYAEGCSIPRVSWDGKQSVLLQAPLADEEAAIAEAVARAAAADVAIVCVGGSTQTSTEAFFVDGIKGDRATLGLLGNQRTLVERVAATGTPTVIVLMGGRPFSIPEIARLPVSLLNTFYLGETNGRAVAKILFGDLSPSGKLPVTIPRSVGQLPVYYSQKAISHYKDYLDEEPGPLFPFGFGLSYGRFSYSDLVLEKTTISAGEDLGFSVTIENTGGRPAAEVVQVYFRDCVASVVRSAKLLIRFQKVQLDPGVRRRLRFSITPREDLAFTGIDLTRRVEAGAFELMIGSSSADIRLQAHFTLSPSP